MKKNLWFWVAIFVIVGLLIALALYDKYAGTPVASNPSPAESGKTGESAKEAAGIPGVEIPSANPLNQVRVNPVGETNPFKDVYENPFE